MNESTPVMKRLCSEQWFEGYCAGLRVAFARPLEFGAQHKLDLSDTREHQTCPGLDNSAPVLADQPRLPGASSAAQEARTGVAASINILRAVLEHAITGAFPAPASGGAIYQKRSTTLTSHKNPSTALKDPAPSDSGHGHLSTRTETGCREKPTHGDNTALIPPFSAAVQDSSAVPPISPEVETCPIGEKGLNDPQTPLSTQDPSRPEYPVDGGSAKSTHGDLSSCTDKSLNAQQEVLLGTAIDLAAEIDETSRTAEYCGNVQSPSVAEVLAEHRIEDSGCTVSRASTEFPDIEEICDRYRRSTGAGSGAQFQSQPPVHPPEVIDLTVSDDDIVRNTPDGANSKKRSHSDDNDLGRRQHRKRAQQPVSRRSKRLEAALAAYLPVTIMVTVEGSIVEFKWDERLKRWHNVRSDRKWNVSELLENVVYVQVTKEADSFGLYNDGSRWKGSDIAGRTLYFEDAEIMSMISRHRMGESAFLAW